MLNEIQADNKPFHPDDLPSLNLDTYNAANRGLVYNQNILANSVYPDETAHYEPSHLDIRCLH